MTVKNLVSGNADEEALEEPGQYASPPCYQHEIDPLYQGFPDGIKITRPIPGTRPSGLAGSEKMVPAPRFELGTY